MHGEVWQPIVDEISLEQDLSQQNVVEIIKNQLRKKYFSIYVEWRRGEFKVDHPFQSECTQCTLLNIFSSYGAEKAVKALLEDGADANEVGGILGGTPLHHAAENGHIKVVEALLEKGANVCALGSVDIYFNQRYIEAIWTKDKKEIANLS
ncbi:ankyrin repeat domain-containing protein [Wolbachia endosymbiont of Pentalonia nigronervosa]|jgi:ankyrin repeat protein|uniref:ankyrin repeat domain-containing protein n=1 Tax=Wolbachia endosymbiont of Pentalonia nigronervosa TaxID=1301914 RepID=UPI00165F6EF6|nr:ankyrin repeat domain-containing protein [Wolbachia endosymbiont of Pentalonia nigronervosa]MBD0391255.1 ankyrin repeat domain-containing protein [Wolbachia endosymbiont of Pentalonia nigronervosa]